jgi:hypothetical protein
MASSMNVVSCRHPFQEVEFDASQSADRVLRQGALTRISTERMQYKGISSTPSGQSD